MKKGVFKYKAEGEYNHLCALRDLLTEINIQCFRWGGNLTRGVEWDNLSFYTTPSEAADMISLCDEIGIQVQIKKWK